MYAFTVPIEQTCGNNRAELNTGSLEIKTVVRLDRNKAGLVILPDSKYGFDIGAGRPWSLDDKVWRINKGKPHLGKIKPKDCLEVYNVAEKAGASGNTNPCISPARVVHCRF